jgi:DNA/RNA-binding domain of Phe-tRNA-synthetase-like protein
MSVTVEIEPTLSRTLSIGVVEAEQIAVEASNQDLRSYCAEVVERAKAKFETPEYAQECKQVRQLLRFGSFKPTGRSKPAQEYLMRCVITDGALPRINAPVDLLNAVSVDFNLPISLLSIAKCSNRLLIERGKPGEQFIFNSAGQILELTDLITVYDCSPTPPRPVGSPVKDSMAGKIGSSDTCLVAIIYSPNTELDMERCKQAQRRLAEGFTRYCR